MNFREISTPCNIYKWYFTTWTVTLKSYFAMHVTLRKYFNLNTYKEFLKYLKQMSPICKDSCWCIIVQVDVSMLYVSSSYEKLEMCHMLWLVRCQFVNINTNKLLIIYIDYLRTASKDLFPTLLKYWSIRFSSSRKSEINAYSDNNWFR